MTAMKKKNFKTKVTEVITSISNQLNAINLQHSKCTTSMTISNYSDNTIEIIDTHVSKVFGSKKPRKINKFNGCLYLRFKKHI